MVCFAVVDNLVVEGILVAEEGTPVVEGIHNPAVVVDSIVVGCRIVKLVVEDNLVVMFLIAVKVVAAVEILVVQYLIE